VDKELVYSSTSDRAEGTHVKLHGKGSASRRVLHPIYKWMINLGRCYQIGKGMSESDARPEILAVLLVRKAVSEKWNQVNYIFK
jgi:hypothetical protein